MKNDFLKIHRRESFFSHDGFSFSSRQRGSNACGGDFCTVGSAIGKCERASAGCGGYSRYWCKCS